MYREEPFDCDRADERYVGNKNNNNSNNNNAIINMSKWIAGHNYQHVVDHVMNHF